MKRLIFLSLITLISFIACDKQVTTDELVKKIFSASLTKNERIELMKTLKTRREDGEIFEIKENTGNEFFRPLSDEKKLEFVSGVAEEKLLNLDELVYYHSFICECFPDFSQKWAYLLWNEVLKNKPLKIVTSEWFGISLREDMSNVSFSFNSSVDEIRKKYVPVLIQAAIEANEKERMTVLNFCQTLRLSFKNSGFLQIALIYIKASDIQFIDYCENNSLKLDGTIIKKIGFPLESLSYEFLLELQNRGHVGFADVLLNKVDSFDRVLDVLNLGLDKEKVYKKAFSFKKESISINQWKLCFFYDKKLFKLLRN